MRHRAKLALASTARRTRLALNQRSGSPTHGRLLTLAGEIGGRPRVDASMKNLLQEIAPFLVGGEPDRVWFVHSVARGELPTAPEVLATSRIIRLDGPLAGLRDILEQPSSSSTVRVVRGAVLVDLEHTAATELATGIQRVARETARRWADREDIVVVGWNESQTGLRVLTEPERRQALGLRLTGPAELPASRTGGPPPPVDDAVSEVVVPADGVYVLPELAVEQRRTDRMLAMARYSRLRTAVIGFDCVPLTSAETTGGAMGSAFAGNLAAVREMDAVATISHAAATEYRGWRSMLAGAGLQGPDIAAVVLPVEANEPTPKAIDEARERLTVGSLPMVLCVGSHEPRKNHLAVLHAAEVSWRAGARFNLIFVGGNAWNSERFVSTLQRLQAAGYPVESIKALPDDLLWAAYRLARCVVFPSLNEGFGLPVAEALASGTPAITSRFGSMAEIAADGGAVLVDPHDDHQLAEALQRLVQDDDEHAHLANEARARPTRTWDDYAVETWSFLVEGKDPSATG